MDDHAEWVGRTQLHTDMLAAAPVAALRATLDLPQQPVDTGLALPPLWHWLYF